jgi:hypothetical protein
LIYFSFVILPFYFINKKSRSTRHGLNLGAIPCMAADSLVPNRSFKKGRIPGNSIWRKSVEITGIMFCQLPLLLPPFLNMFSENLKKKKRRASVV